MKQCDTPSPRADSSAAKPADPWNTHSHVTRHQFTLAWSVHWLVLSGTSDSSRMIHHPTQTHGMPCNDLICQSLLFKAPDMAANVVLIFAGTKVRGSLDTRLSPIHNTFARICCSSFFSSSLCQVYPHFAELCFFSSCFWQNFCVHP